MRFSVSVAALAILLFLGLPIPSRGTDKQGSVCNLDPSTALVFVGTLTNLTSAGSRPGWSIATLQVTEPLRGQSPAIVNISMPSALCHDDLETAIRVGAAYLVQTVISSAPIYQIGDCEQIRPIEKATAALGYLRSSQVGNALTEVSVEARVETQGYPWKKIPLAQTKIHLVGPNQRLDFVSDDDGRFQGTLSPGKYAVTAEFPTGYEAGFYRVSEVHVIEHRCTLIMLSARPTASFTAHIVDVDGEHLGIESNVQLTLETADDQQFVQSVWPDEKSDLEADHLLPGRYILGLNTYLPVSRSTPRYPPIYFPGVGTRSEAQVITLAPGEHKVLAEMRIKKGRECEIPVLVVDTLGKPSPSAVVALAYSDYPRFYLGPNEQTDKNGRETIYAVFPGPVFLRAEKQREDGSTVRSENLEVSSCPAEPVILKLGRVVVDQPERNEK